MKNHCAYCHGKFGMVRHRRAFKAFCSQKCLDRHKAWLRAEARTRKGWFDCLWSASLNVTPYAGERSSGQSKRPAPSTSRASNTHKAICLAALLPVREPHLRVLEFDCDASAAGLYFTRGQDAVSCFCVAQLSVLWRGREMFQTRRNFLTVAGGAAAWPLASYAQQPAMPVIGFLSPGSPRTFAPLTAAFRDGLRSQGYAEGRNVFIDYRWAEGHYDELPALAAALVRRPVDLIAAAGGVLSAQAAKSATSTIPVLFVAGFDPVQLDLVASLNKPGGNLTGVSVLTTELAAKRLELLHDLLPSAQTIALLVNPGSVASAIEAKDTAAAAQRWGIEVLVLEAATDRDLEAAFASAAMKRASALLVSADPFFTLRRAELVALAARHALPAMYPWREYVEAGGLLSYGTELTWAYHQIGVYAGRIIKGATPAELPVHQPTDFDLVINLNTAKALGLTVPSLLLVRANKTIE